MAAGGASTSTTTRNDTAAIVQSLFGSTPVDPAAEVELVDWDPEAEDKILAAICYSHSTLPETQLLERVRGLGIDERVSLLRAYVGERENRRHKPGRAFERSFYRFDVLSDYGAFRDMQRHRMLTIEWQRLTPNHGYTRPDLVEEAGVGEVFDEAMQRSAALYDALQERYHEQASYAVSMAYRMRYVMQFNAREAMHMLELRSSAPGPPVVPARGAGDASPDRRAGRPLRDRPDDGAHDHRGARTRAPRVGAARRGASRQLLSPTIRIL